MSDKTEEPTALRLRQARLQGNVPRSPDLVAAVTLIAGLATLAVMWHHSAHLLAAWLETNLTRLDHPPELLPLLMLLAQILAPVALASAAGSIGVQWAYSGFLMTSLKFDPSRLNFMAAAQRMFSRKMAVEAFRLGIKISILSVLSWKLFQEVLFPWVTSAHNLAACTLLAGRLTVFTAKVALAYFSLGALDALYQKWEYRVGLRMTKDEVKREYKQQDGDPHIKARMRQLARKLSRSRNLDGVKDATVVVTNPTRLAVALKYLPGMPCPIVVAKGKGPVAAAIRKLARHHNVPLVEDKPVARALIHVDVDHPIPSKMFQAVAAILVAVAKADRRVPR